MSRGRIDPHDSIVSPAARALVREHSRATSDECSVDRVISCTCEGARGYIAELHYPGARVVVET